MIGIPYNKHITMPFYEALSFLLNAPSGTKITRKVWYKFYLIKVVGKNNKLSIKITDGHTFEDDFTAMNDSLIARDWYIINEEDMD